MSRSGVRLYDLLPSYIRLRDSDEGQPLAALMNALQEPFERVYADIEELYSAWFIETCASWQVPYIGDLLGVSLPDAWLPSLRSRVANTLAYRRAKGTAVALERVASDVTGWPCFVGEGRAQAVQTLSVSFAKTETATFNLRDPLPLGPARSPFEPRARTVALGPGNRTPSLGDDGRRNLSDVSLSLWRVRGYPVHRGELRRLSGAGDRGPAIYSFHPLGVEAPLFDQSARPDRPLFRSGPDNVPTVLGPRRLRQALDSGQAEGAGAGQARVLRIYLQRRPVVEARTVELETVSSEEICIESLADDTMPMLPLGLALESVQGPTQAIASRLARSGTLQVRSKVIVDPLRGRLVAIDRDVEAVFADFTFGGVADLGGGSYSRTCDVPSLGKNPWRAVVIGDGNVSATERPPGVRYFSSLGQALVAWNGQARRAWPVPPAAVRTPAAERGGLIVIADSRLHTLPKGAVVENRHRNLVIMAAEGCRPVIVGDLRLIGSRSYSQGEALPSSQGAQSPRPVTATRSSRILLDGLSIDGTLQAVGGLALDIRYCLLAPPCSCPGRNDRGRYAIDVPLSGAHLQLAITRSICGALRLADGVQMTLTESVVQGHALAIDGGSAAAGGSRAEVERCTVLGPLRCGVLTAVDSLFAGMVTVARPEVGELAHCFVPQGSRTPVLRQSVTAPWPIFLSTRLGDLGYARLAPNTPKSITHGGSLGEEIGVFSFLRQNARLKNLDDVLAAYLPPGKTPRIIFET